MQGQTKCCASKQQCQQCKGESCPHSVNWMSNDELTEKLLERSTFMGIVIRSEHEVLPGTEHKNFLISCNKQIDPKDLANILVAAATAIMNGQ